MLGKVLKYDLKTLVKSLIPLYVVLIGLSLMIRLLGFFDKVSVIAIILGLMIAALVLVDCLSFVLTGIFSVKYYLENLFKDQGYLTHTLPVKKGTLLLSKVLSSLIMVILTFTVVVLNLIIAFYQVGLFSDIINAISQSIAGMEVYKLLIFLVAYGLISYLTTLLMVYAAIAIGFSKSSNKIVSSVVWALIFYFAMEFIYLGVLSCVLAINPAFITNMDNNTFRMSDLLNFFMIFMIFTVLVGVVYYFISYRFINKKLNLE